MQEAENALDIAKSGGASYADIRVISTQMEFIEVKDGRIGQIQRKESLGFGIRLILNGAWGFASSAELSKEKVQTTAKEAIEIGRASSTVIDKPVRLASAENFIAKWQTPYIVDPFNVSIDEKLKLLLEIDKRLRSVKGVTTARAFLHFIKKDQLFLSTEGSKIEQTILWSGVSYSATAVDKNETQIRSFPQPFGQYGSAGYEFITKLGLLENATRVAEESVQLLRADPCPVGEKDLILGSSQLALQIHESCGHPSELDRVLGTEANFAGTSFLTIDKIGKFRYGSNLVNIYADSISPGGLGTFGYDDEGTPAGRWNLVKDGIFAGYLTSRETAPVIGQKRSQGAMRADGYNRMPIIRMVNVSLESRKGTLDQLISDTKDGVFMDFNRSWSIDQQRLNFQFGCEVGWEVKNGKKTRMLKNPTYQGITPEFWNSCDAICGPEEWNLWGIPSCGKGEPMQVMGVGHGSAPARFRKTKVGVGYGR
jgi:TldD protein